MLFGVGNLHPRVSLFLEMGDRYSRNGGSANGVVGKNVMHPFLVQSAGKQSV